MMIKKKREEKAERKRRKQAKKDKKPETTGSIKAPSGTSVSTGHETLYRAFMLKLFLQLTCITCEKHIFCAFPQRCMQAHTPNRTSEKRL